MANIFKYAHFDTHSLCNAHNGFVLMANCSDGPYFKSTYLHICSLPLIYVTHYLYLFVNGIVFMPKTFALVCIVSHVFAFTRFYLPAFPERSGAWLFVQNKMFVSMVTK